MLVHFPIALCIVGVAFDLAALWKNRKAFADAAFYNLTIAAVFTIPVMATGILAWQFALEGQALKGILRLHLILGVLSSLTIWTIWTLHFLARRKGGFDDSCLVAICAGIGGDGADFSDGTSRRLLEWRKWGSLVPSAAFFGL